MTIRQFTTLFENHVLSHLERMRLNPLRRRTNRSRGEHLSGRGGTSTEFADYRDYVPGDDLRAVDWNIFARLNRAYIKQYQHEEELHVVIIMDGSTSMRFEGKFDRCTQLAGAFAVMGLMNLERVSLFVCTEESSSSSAAQLCALRGKGSFRRMFKFLETVECGGTATIDSAVTQVLRRHQGRGIAVLLSDFLTFGDMQKPLNRLFSAGLETFAVQVLGPGEISPELAGDLRLIDSETEFDLDLSATGDLLTIYQECRLSLETKLATICRRGSGRFLSIGSRAPLEWVLFDLFRRQGWTR